MPARRNRKRRVPEVRIITERNAVDLVASLDDPGRDTPVVLISNRSNGGPVASPEEIAERLHDDVPVWWFEGAQAQWAVSNLQGGKYSTYGGAIRTVVRGGRSDVVVVTMHDEDADRTPARVQQAVMSARAILKPPTSSQDSERGRDDDQERLAMLEKTVKQGAAENRRLTQIVEQLQDVNRETKKRVLEVEQRLDSLDTAPEALFTNPVEQFRHEVQQAWLAQVDPQERDQWPLRKYTLGPDFLDNVDDNGSPLASRPRVVAAVVDVLTRRAYELPGRNVHPQTQGGTGPPMVRDGGAMAYRAYISTGPSGPRLVWWELPDGAAELARVAQHDDYRLR